MLKAWKNLLNIMLQCQFLQAVLSAESSDLGKPYDTLSCRPIVNVWSSFVKEPAAVGCGVERLLDVEISSVLIISDTGFDEYMEVSFKADLTNSSIVVNHQRRRGTWSIFYGNETFLNMFPNYPAAEYYGIYKLRPQCIAPLLIRCGCKVGPIDSPGSFQYARVEVLRVDIPIQVTLPTLTPLAEIWGHGVGEGAFVGAQCEALVQPDSLYSLSWNLYRGNARERIRRNDTRVKFGETNFAYSDASDENGVITVCINQKIKSSISFEVSRLDTDLTIECALSSTTRGVEEAVTVRTDPLAVYSGVSEDFTYVWLMENNTGFDHIVQCHSISVPEANITWHAKDSPETVLNSSVGRGPLNLNFSALPAHVRAGNEFICHAWNVAFGERHEARVLYSARPKKGAFLEEVWAEHRNYTEMSLVAVVSVGSILGLVVLVSALLAEQRNNRRDQKARSQYDHRRSFEVDSFRPSMESEGDESDSFRPAGNRGYSVALARDDVY